MYNGYSVMKSLLCTLYTLLLLSVSVFTVSRSLPDMLVEAKWYATLVVCMSGAMAFVVYMFISRRRFSCAGLLDIFEISAVVVCAAQAIFFLLQWAGLCRGYVVTASGSFDNVAGMASCLCLSLPLGWKWLSVFMALPKTIWRDIVALAFILCKIVCVVAVVISASRAGMLCVLFFVALWALHRYRMVLAGVIVIMIVSSCVLALCIKKDSSYGRWFIMQRTLEMIAAKPLTGWGTGGFDAHYMDVQADYFAANPDSEYAMLADDVRHPLNEYLLVAVNYGLPGLAVVVLLAAGIIVFAIRHRSVVSPAAVIVFGCIMTFSLFSYPFLYPFTWLMLGYSLLSIFCRSVRLRRMTCITVLVVLAIVTWKLTGRIGLAAELRRVQDKAEYGMARSMLPHYARLYSVMKTDYSFLYNYSTVLYDTGHYSEALCMADECGEYLSDYGLCMLSGDICMALGDADGAVSAYSRAHNMCPCRFAPLYEIACIHRETGNIVAAQTVAREILCKRVKVPSAAINKMKREMSDLLRDT